MVMPISKTLIAILSLSFSFTVDAVEGYDRYLSLMGMTLEETNLHAIREKLGNTPLKNDDDSYSICYSSKQSNATLFFGSNELGGSKQRLLNFYVKNGVAAEDQCTAITADPKLFRLGAIELGKDINTVKRQLPQPVEEIKERGLLHRYYGKIPFSKKEIERLQVEDLNHAFWSLLLFIEVFEEQGVVSGYKVSKLTSWQ
ncbi:MAG: hypothetical protein FD130_489 [Halothiobacillaceae bacterium]|nr:MAG: hypothetical protein FD130_489 [Halothiobacillaceae bacterium]